MNLGCPLIADILPEMVAGSKTTRGDEMMLRKPVLLGLAVLLCCCAWSAPRAQLIPAAARPPASAPSNNLDNFQARILALHNRYRDGVGVPRLQWDARLAADAQQYAPELVAAGRLVHAPRNTRPGQGENLWMGTAGAYRLEAMLENWAQERSLFRAGIFPNVSTRGSWSDVTHYSQMIWPTSTHIGCALQSSPRWDYLVCRYAPSGNRDGQRVP